MKKQTKKQTMTLSTEYVRKLEMLSRRKQKSKQDLLEQALDEFFEREAPNIEVEQNKSKQMTLTRALARKFDVGVTTVFHDFKNLSVEQLTSRYNLTPDKAGELKNFVQAVLSSAPTILL